jgi:hypothetical protein
MNDDTEAARVRYYAELNRQLAARGLPPVAMPPKQQHPRLVQFAERTDATSAFIQMNEERIARGEAPLTTQPAGEGSGPDSFWSDAKAKAVR